MTTTARRRRVDDDEFDPSVHEARYWPRLVYKDGAGPRVPLYLTDSSARPDPAANRPGYLASRLYPPRSALSDAQRAVEDARSDYIRRTSEAWRTPIGLKRDETGGGPFDFHRPGALAGGYDFTTDPVDQTSAYARGVWAQQGNHGPDGNEAYTRRMSLSEPDATPDSVRAERARFKPRDSAAASAAQAIRDEAYGDYVARLQNAWRS
jgi:hypothetical protein